MYNKKIFLEPVTLIVTMNSLTNRIFPEIIQIL